MEQLVLELGVGGLFALFIIREVLTFLKDKKNSAAGAEDLSKLCRQVEELHVWHSKTDQDGVPVWYVRRSLEDAIEKLAENIEKQTDLFHAMHREMADVREAVKQQMGRL